MSKHLIGVVAATVGVAGLAVASGGPASAANGSTIKADAAAAISARETALSATEALIRSLPYLGADQQTELNAMAAAASGLTSLGQTIQADATAAQAAADAAKIRTEYRVFALVIPVAHIVRAADAGLNVAIPALQAVATSLQGHVTGNDQQLLTDMQSQISAASGDLTGLPAQVEAYTPAQWNADPALLKPSWSNLGAARTALARAHDDGRQIIADLAKEG